MPTSAPKSHLILLIFAASCGAGALLFATGILLNGSEQFITIASLGNHVSSTAEDAPSDGMQIAAPATAEVPVVNVEREIEAADNTSSFGNPERPQLSDATRERLLLSGESAADFWEFKDASDELAEIGQTSVAATACSTMLFSPRPATAAYSDEAPDDRASRMAARLLGSHLKNTSDTSRNRINAAFLELLGNVQTKLSNARRNCGLDMMLTDKRLASKTARMKKEIKMWKDLESEIVLLISATDAQIARELGPKTDSTPYLSRSTFSAVNSSKE